MEGVNFNTFKVSIYEFWRFYISVTTNTPEKNCIISCLTKILFSWILLLLKLTEWRQPKKLCHNKNTQFKIYWKYISWFCTDQVLFVANKQKFSNTWLVMGQIAGLTSLLSTLKAKKCSMIKVTTIKIYDNYSQQYP